LPKVKVKDLAVLLMYDAVICEGNYGITMFKKVMDMQQPVWDDTEEGFMIKTWL
jgi:hypothetical protein